MSADPYAVLGVAGDASQSEITSAYRTLLRRHHPDTRDAQVDARAGDAALRRVIAAYLLLGDPDRRSRYDHQVRRQGMRGASRVDAPAPGARQAPDIDPRDPPLRAGPVRWERR